MESSSSHYTGCHTRQKHRHWSDKSIMWNENKLLIAIRNIWTCRQSRLRRLCSLSDCLIVWLRWIWVTELYALRSLAIRSTTTTARWRNNLWRIIGQGQGQGHGVIACPNVADYRSANRHRSKKISRPSIKRRSKAQSLYRQLAECRLIDLMHRRPIMFHFFVSTVNSDRCDWRNVSKRWQRDFIKEKVQLFVFFWFSVSFF